MTEHAGARRDEVGRIAHDGTTDSSECSEEHELHERPPTVPRPARAPPGHEVGIRNQDAVEGRRPAARQTLPEPVPVIDPGDPVRRRIHRDADEGALFVDGRYRHPIGEQGSRAVVLHPPVEPISVTIAADLRAERAHLGAAPLM